MTLIIALVFLVACSAFFSASETAFSSLNQIRLKSRAEDGDASAARVLAMAEKYDKLLSTILIGNNIVNIAAASIGTIIFTKMLGEERGATVSTMVLTVVVLIFGEVTPKSLAKEMPETVATAVSPMLNLLMVLFTPLTWLFSQWKRLLGHFVHSTEEDTITEGELMTMVSEAENDGELTDRESELIRSAIEFDDVEVEEILTPRVDVVAVEDNTSLDEVAQTFAESGYSRLPVYHDTIDNIIGVVHEKDFYLARLKKETSLEELVKPTLYTTGSTQISQLLRTLREQHHHLAVVVDEYEYKLRLEEIKTLNKKGRFQESAQIADTIDWKKVRNTSTLGIISDVYKINRRFDDAREILLLANEKSPQNRRIVYALCDLAIKTGQVVEAVEY